jgi:hypothetical protein
MNKVYFSNEAIDAMDKWDNTGGILKVFIYPKNIFSFHGWRMAIMFMRDFSCAFLNNQRTEQ